MLCFTRIYADKVVADVHGKPGGLGQGIGAIVSNKKWTGCGGELPNCQNRKTGLVGRDRNLMYPMTLLRPYGMVVCSFT